jgi:hypothetical protein
VRATAARGVSQVTDEPDEKARDEAGGEGGSSMSAFGTTINRRQVLKGNSAEAIHFRTTLTRNIRRAALQSNLSLLELGMRVGLTRDRMETISAGEANVSAIELAFFARALNVTTDELVKGGVE